MVTADAPFLFFYTLWAEGATNGEFEYRGVLDPAGIQRV
jgi:hypothetical protein